MSTASIISDFDRLVAPIEGEDPAGRPVSFVTRQKLDAARKDINPSDFAPTDPLRPTEAKPADWDGIIRQAQDILAEESKDLMTASRMTEALTRSYGYGGLRDGLILFRRLIDEAWDRLTPPIEDGDLDVRAAPFNWLDDPDRGARFPGSIRNVPMFSDSIGPITWLGWKNSQVAVASPDDSESSGPPFTERFDKAVAAASRQHCQDLVDDLTTGLAELEHITKALDEKLQDSAPGMGEVRKAMTECLDLAKRILEKKGPAFNSAPAPAAAPAESAAAGMPAPVGASTPMGNGFASTMLTRDDVYHRLAEAAELLQRLEPHSPIPFMIQRAVALGRLPFPELIKVMIRDPGVVEQLSRELGLEQGN